MVCRQPKDTPLEKLWIMYAIGEPASRLSRIITPALAQALVLTRLSTLTVIEPLPLSCL